MTPSFSAQEGKLAAKEPQASGTAVLTHWASVVWMVYTAVSMDITATPPPCHAEDGTRRSPQEHENPPTQTKEDTLFEFVHCDSFAIILIHTSDQI